MLEGNHRRVALHRRPPVARSCGSDRGEYSAQGSEEHAGRDIDWERIALTERQVNASKFLRESVIEKLDARYKPPKVYRAVECEAIGQKTLLKLVQESADRQLPEPLAAVLVREEREAEEAHALIAKWRS